MKGDQDQLTWTSILLNLDPSIHRVNYKKWVKLLDVEAANKNRQFEITILETILKL